jgi:hypothetical protein
MFQWETKLHYCPFYALLGHQTPYGQMERGFHLPYMWQYYLEGKFNADI